MTRKQARGRRLHFGKRRVADLDPDIAGYPRRKKIGALVDPCNATRKIRENLRQRLPDVPGTEEDDVERRLDAPDRTERTERRRRSSQALPRT
jgi:hypothetical protein